MSKTIDQRVVEMQFDNARFERNVQTSMSTLAKLKQSLNLTGAAKGLESINAAAKSSNISALGTAAETVGTKFSAMQVAGITAIANIANEAVNAGKRIVSALTIDPIKTGLSEYETKINAIQVIQANTRGKNSMDDITKALDDLNTYADKTIYNFAQMTSNIGKFTAQGLDVYEAANAVKGLANVAAASGASAEDMARATYQMSQALGGTIKLMDWNSLRNANMATVELKNTLIDLAKVHGIAIDEMIEEEGTFEQTLSKGWLTGEMFTEAMNIYSGVYDEAELKAMGFTDSQVKNFQELAAMAESAATEVKTFTQLWDVLKETAQSGWTQTWELLIGDFDTAKKMFTQAQVFFSDIINGWSDARNNLLKAALDSPFGKLFEKIQNVTKATEKVVEATKNYEEIVNKVIRGEFGTGQSRWDKLAEDGYNWAKVQNMVNEKLGSSVRHNEELAEAQIKSNKAQADGNEGRAVAIEQLVKMSDAELKAIGFTEDEIESLRLLEEVAKKAGYSLEEVIKNPELINGRTLLIDGFKNLGKAIGAVVKVAKEAWQDIFPPKSLEERAEKIYMLIAAFRGFTENLILTGDNAEYLKRTLKGVFAAIDIILTVLGGPLKWAFDAVIKLLGKFDINILEYTANIGDALVKLRDWIDENNLFLKGIEFIAPYLKKAIDAFKEWIDEFKEAHGIGEDLIDGLVNGLKDGTKKVVEKAIELGKKILENIKEVLGIHSPSTKMFEIGINLIEGLVNGIVTGAKRVYNAVKDLAGKIIDAFKDSKVGEKSSAFFGKIVDFIANIDFGKLFAAGLGIGGLIAVIKTIATFAKAIEVLASPLEGLGDMLEGLGDMFKSIGKNFKAAAFEKRMNGVYSFAKAIGVLALSIFLLASIPTGKLWATIGAIAALAAIMGGLAALAALMSKGKDGIIDFDFGVTALGILGIAAAILVLSIALKKMASIDSADLPKTLGIFAGIITGMAVLFAAFGKFVTGDAAKNMGQAGKMLVKMSVAMLIMVGVIKLASMLNGRDVAKGLTVVLSVGVLFAGLIAVSKLAGKHASKAGGMLFKMSLAFLAMVGVIKLASMLHEDEINRGIKVIGTVGILFTALIAVTKLAGANAGKAGGMLLLMSLSLAIIVQVVKQIVKLDDKDLIKGVGVVAILELFFAGLIAVSYFAGQHAVKAGAMLLLMSGALIILTGVLFVLSKIEPSGLYTALGVVAVLELLFAALIAATGKAQKVTGTLIVLTVAVALLAGAIAGLSFIEPQQLAIATAALSAIVGVFTLLVLATTIVKDPVKMGGTLAQLLGVTAVLALIVAGLAQIDSASALPNCAALSILLLSFSASLVIISNAGSHAARATSALVPMLGVVAGLAVILGAMSALGVEASIPTATALGILLNAMSAAMLILSYTSPIGTKAVTAMMLMGVVVAELAVILGLMAHYDVQPSIETATALSILLTGMSAALLLLSAIGPTASLAIPATGTLIAVVGIIGAALIAIGELMNLLPDSEYQNIMAGLDRFIGLFEKLGYGIGSVIGNVVAGFADGVMDILPNFGSKLTEFMTNAQGFIDGAKAIDESVLTGVGVLAGALLAITGAELIAGLASFLSGGVSLSELGTELSAFMNNAQDFIIGASMLDESMLTGVKALASVILTLTAAEVLDGIASFFGMGESSLSTFGAQLPALGSNIAAFATNLGSFTEAQTASVGFAADAIVKLAQAANQIPNEGGWAAKILGDNSISTFGAKLPGLGLNLRGFVINLGTFSEDQVSTIKCAADAIVAIAEAAQNIPNEGGWAAKILGDNSISTFGAKLPALGLDLSAFATNLGTFSEAQVTTVGCAASAIAKIAEAAKNIPNEGGWAAKILGDNSIATFGAKLPTLGTNLASFATNLGTFDEAKVATVGCAANAIKEMAAAASSIDAQPGWAAKIFGDNSLATFGTQLSSLGTNLKAFVTNLGTFTNTQVATVNAAVNAINAFAGLADTDLKAAKNNLSGFGDKIVELATDIKSFITNMPASESITTAISSIKKILDAIDDLAAADSSAATSFTNSLKTMAKDAISAFIKAFTEKEPDVKQAAKDLANEAVKGAESKEADMKKAGTKLADKLEEGIEDGESDVKKAAGNMAKAGKDKIRDYYDDFKSAGSYLVSGFAAGISENDYKATAKAKAMAKAAKQAAEDALGIKSPSRVFYGIGEYVVAGFVKALTAGTSDVDKASTTMADSARSGFAAAIIGVTEALNTDMDLQPTIRPVLDLSGVESGVGAIDGLFNSTHSVGTMANLRAINAMTGQNGQNGNDDVISAINRLGRKLDNVGNTNYNINGITYDDGSNIAEAIETITRVAKIARRN